MKDWQSFWSEKKTGFDFIMRNTTPFFYEQYLSKNPLKTNKIILDYGCGPGFLIEKIPKENTIIGADISRDYIEICNEKFADSPNTSFELITESNTFQHILSKTKPDLIIAVSVVQYFENDPALKKFIDDVKNYSKECDKRVQLVIADVIPNQQSKLRDAFEVCFHSIRTGYFLDFLRFMREVLSSDYSKTQLKVNKTDPEFFDLYAKENNVKIEFLNKVTVNTNRYSVAIFF